MAAHATTLAAASAATMASLFTSGTITLKFLQE